MTNQQTDGSRTHRWLLFFAFVATLIFVLPCVAQVTVTSEQWKPATDGKHLVRLKTIFEKTYKIPSPRILQQHIPGMQGVFGDVEMFQISQAEECGTKKCYYALFSDEVGDSPFLTNCEPGRWNLAHNHHPDGSNFFVFEFSCGDSFTYVRISRGHFWINSSQSKR
jgi:hypothetical protein